MRICLFILVISVQAALAQVESTTNIRLTGAAPENKVSGLAMPQQNSAAISVEASVAGIAHWCTATINGNTILLDQQVDPDLLRPNMILRFLAPSSLSGPIQIEVAGAPGTLPLLRPDGFELGAGQVSTGVVVEIVNTVDHWVLLAPLDRGCPPNTLQVRDGLCMDIASAPQQSVFLAIDLCQAKGGKLCTWDEYYSGCTVLAGQLTGMFEQWEWIDDTSNHAHTGDQAGRLTCQSQRSANPVITTYYGKTRCCYHIR